MKQKQRHLAISENAEINLPKAIMSVTVYYHF